jgi:hypothetical protein
MTTPAAMNRFRALPQMFDCPRCGGRHRYGEPGFNWPDAVFALALSEEEKLAIRAPGDNEDIAIVRGACFVRCIALFSVASWAAPFGVGFWLRISRDDFMDFERRGRFDHPTYTGHIANQSNLLGPTLGLRATMAFLGQGLRPTLALERPHPLAEAQANGITEPLACKWMAETFHEGEPDPLEPPRRLELARDGYRVLTAREAGRPPAQLTEPLAVGQYVKVVVELLVSDEQGDPQEITAGWWFQLDHVAPDGTCTGTLTNVPRVPAALSRGARVWMDPDHIIEHNAG